MLRNVTPYSLVEYSERNRHGALIVACLAIIFATAKTEAVRVFETWVYFYPTIRRYTPENTILHSHRCEKFTSKTEYMH
jgi:hypothetical protein